MNPYNCVDAAQGSMCVQFSQFTRGMAYPLAPPPLAPAPALPVWRYIPLSQGTCFDWWSAGGPVTTVAQCEAA